MHNVRETPSAHDAMIYLKVANCVETIQKLVKLLLPKWGDKSGKVHPFLYLAVWISFTLFSFPWVSEGFLWRCQAWDSPRSLAGCGKGYFTIWHQIRFRWAEKINGILWAKLKPSRALNKYRTTIVILRKSSWFAPSFPYSYVWKKSYKYVQSPK